MLDYFLPLLITSLEKNGAKNPDEQAKVIMDKINNPYGLGMAIDGILNATKQPQKPKISVWSQM